MFRVTQVVRNSLIRVLAFISVSFGFLGKLFGSTFDFIGRSLGFKTSEYFLESDEANTLKKIQAKPVVKAEPSQPVTTTSTSNSKPRRNDPNMDYFRNMAKEVRNSN
jgi:hypothetical protein